MALMRPRAWLGVTATLLGVGVSAHAADRLGAATGLKIPPHQRFTLRNGVKLILIPRHDVPLIAFEAALRGGSRLDPPAEAGLTAMLADLLTHGAGARDAYAFADAVEGAGGSLDAEARSDAVFLHGQFLSRDRALMLELLSDALQRPQFAVSELQKLRERRIEFIKAAKDSDPQGLLGIYGRSLLFGAHPYGKPVGGSEATLALIGREALLDYYRCHVGADRLTLVFAGDFDPAWLAQAVTQAFEGWRAAAEPLSPLPEPARIRGRRVLLVDDPGATQTYFWIGNVGVARRFRERAAFALPSSAFGGSFSSMLMQALRVRSGLTYSVSSNFRRGIAAGEFSISSFTQTESTVQAVDATLATLDALHADGVSEAALASARSYILGQYPLGFETAADWAAALAELALYDLPESDIADFGASLRRVDAAAARQVVREAFPASADLVIVLIGDAARIREAARGWGTVIEKPLEAPDFAVPH